LSRFFTAYASIGVGIAFQAVMRNETLHMSGRSYALSLILALVCTPAAAQQGEIVLGMSAAFRGPSRGLGIELYRGSMAYFNHVNLQGGIHGRKIVIKAYDDGYEPDPAIENTIRLIEQDRVFLLYGYVGTPTVTRVLPLLRKSRDQSISLFFPFTGAEPHRRPPYKDYAFNLRASYRDEAAGLVDHFVAIGRKRIAVFYQIDAYGRSGWEGTREALAKHGLSIVAEATYRRGAKFTESMNLQADKLRQANPDALISVGAYAACAAFIRDARDSGWDVPIANVSFVGSENLLKLLAEHGQAQGRDYTRQLINSQVVPSYEDTTIPAVCQYLDFMDRYQPTLPSNLIQPDYQSLPRSFVSFEGFLDAKLLVEILKNLGPDLRRERIKPAAESLRSFDLGIGDAVSFSPDRHQGLDRVYFTAVQNQRFVPLQDWSVWQK
jgi:branched-chain amino acid transport system substrate-binding protein